MSAEKTKEPLTALYCRLSREDNNDGPSNSIENQKLLLSQYAAKHGYTRTGFFIDDGFSGTTFKRPAFTKMLKGIKKGIIERVIIKDMSRLGRDYLQVGFYTEILFPERGIHFIAINDGVDSQARQDDLLPFRNIVNEWYARDTSRKVRAVLQAKGMSGKPLSTIPPYGYRKGADGRFVIDEDAAVVVRRIFRLYADGMSTWDIARKLRAENVHTPTAHAWLHGGARSRFQPERACAWSGRTIQDMLTRKAYLGHTVNFQTRTRSYKDKRTLRLPESEQRIFENTHPPLIGIELWEEVQQRRAEWLRQNGKVE